MDAKIEIYTRDFCGFCAHAKKLLDSRKLKYKEYNIWEETGKQAEMLDRANGRTTVPQIFINDHHLGGCDDLIDAASSGELDRLINA